MFKNNHKVFSAVAFGLLFSGHALAAGDVTLRFAHWLPEQHPLAKHSFPDWAKSITEASSGTIKFEFYPAQQLGAAKDHYDMARDGVADVTWVNPGYQPGRFPVLGAVEFPFVLTDGDKGSSAVHEWYAPYAKREMKDVKMCITHVNTPGTLHSKTKISAPEDMKGLNIRASNASVATYITKMGGANVQVAAPEAKDALEKGSADAIFYPNGSFWLYNLDHVAKYHVDLPLYTNAATVVINQAAYDGMSAEQQAVIDAHCTAEWAERFAKPWNAFEMAGLDRLRSDSNQIMVKPSEAETQAWVKNTESLREAWAERVNKLGYDADKVWGELVVSLKKHSSAFE